MSTARLF
ncbi:UNVERIFIED_CONTAM: hypothetical protein GTU68_016527 [Idotea baltica]|nr:hypothetical protein [Idotea baltica]